VRGQRPCHLCGFSAGPVLKQIHDDLDAAVAEAYGWPVPSAGSIRLPSALRLRLEESSSKSGQAMTDGQVLPKLVALNAERAVEGEARDHPLVAARVSKPRRSGDHAGVARAGDRGEAG